MTTKIHLYVSQLNIDVILLTATVLQEELFHFLFIENVTKRGSYAMKHMVQVELLWVVTSCSVVVGYQHFISP